MDEGATCIDRSCLVLIVDNSSDPADDEEDENEQEDEIASNGLETAERLLF